MCARLKLKSLQHSMSGKKVSDQVTEAHNVQKGEAGLQKKSTS